MQQQQQQLLYSVYIYRYIFSRRIRFPSSDYTLAHFLSYTLGCVYVRQSFVETVCKGDSEVELFDALSNSTVQLCIIIRFRRLRVIALICCRGKKRESFLYINLRD